MAARDAIRLICSFAILTLAAGPAAAASKSAAEPAQQLSIGGGTVDSAAFRWSSALAEILSRPPGLPECDPSTPCGVPGVIASAQTYDDPKAAFEALVQGRVSSAVIPARRVYEARCAASKPPAQAGITVLRILYRQPVQIVARTELTATGLKSLTGKTVAIGESGSDAEAVGLALIDAYGLSRAKIKLVRLSSTLAVAGLRNGGIGAAIFIGHASDTPIGDLMGHGFTLMSLADTPERRRLLQILPAFEASALPPDSYPGLPPVSILAQPVVWVAGQGLDPALAEKLLGVVSEPHNQTRLSGLVAPFVGVPEGAAFLHLPAPLTEGAARFAKSAKLPVEALECSPAH